jgi:multidrug efflux pump subunit AcrA (membrane-fusion protein)
MTLGVPVTGSAQSEPAQMIVLPWTALSSVNSKPAVWIVDPGDATVSLKPVEIANYETGRVVISGGLSPGDTVVVDGGKMLRPGQKVRLEGEQG